MKNEDNDIPVSLLIVAITITVLALVLAYAKEIDNLLQSKAKAMNHIKGIDTNL